VDSRLVSDGLLMNLCRSSEFLLINNTISRDKKRSNVAVVAFGAGMCNVVAAPFNRFGTRGPAI
jgi:hypothetical protein